MRLGAITVSRGAPFGGVAAGDQFGALQAVAPNRRANVKGHKRWVWSCRCDCGRDVDIPVGNLQSGNSKSCGCMKSERVRRARTEHGQGKRGSTTREYNSWCSMRARCLNERCPKFPIYGGRGITVCARWDSFGNFFADMGRRPVGTTLERNDTDGDYEPGNCRWATPLEQARNRRPVRLNEARVRAIRRSAASTADLAREYGVTPGHILDVRSGRAWPHVR